MFSDVIIRIRAINVITVSWGGKGLIATLRPTLRQLFLRGLFTIRKSVGLVLTQVLLTSNLRIVV